MLHSELEMVILMTLTHVHYLLTQFFGRLNITYRVVIGVVTVVPM